MFPGRYWDVSTSFILQCESALPTWIAYTLWYMCTMYQIYPDMMSTFTFPSSIYFFTTCCLARKCPLRPFVFKQAPENRIYWSQRPPSNMNLKQIMFVTHGNLHPTVELDLWPSFSRVWHLLSFGPLDLPQQKHPKTTPKDRTNQDHIHVTSVKSLSSNAPLKNTRRRTGLAELSSTRTS